MNAMNMMATSVRGMNLPAGMQGLQGLIGSAAGGSDAFAMIFQQLLGGMDGEWAGLLESLGNMQEGEEKDGTQLAMQMMAEMLFAGGTADLQQLMQQAGLQESSSEMQDTGKVLLPLAQESLPQAAERIEESPANAQQAGQTEGKETVSGIFSQMLGQAAGASRGGQQEGHDLLRGQSQFRSAVQEVQRKLQDRPQEEVQPVDVDSLQAAVNEKRFAPVLTSKTAEQPLPEPQEVTQQLKTGILQNLSRGKNEFVVKLKPEGLGEITVKMLEQDSKISLSIVASSPQIAKLISDEAVALQNALRPLHAEVTEVTSTAVQQSAQTAAESGLMEQNFQHQHQQFAQQPFYGQVQDNDTEEFDAVPLDTAPQQDSELDTYI